MTIDVESGLDYLSARELEEERDRKVARKGRVQTVREEIANTLTHGAGLVLAAIGLCVLVLESMTSGGTHHVVACSVFGSTMVTTYLASTLYHSVQVPRVKHWLRVFDHITIYLLIAGTYTPFMLVSLRGDRGFTFFCIVWALAAAGVVYKLLLFGKYERISLASYLGMGWIAVFVVEPLWNELPGTALALMAAGGLSYSFGVIFYVQQHKRYYHTIWHLFVMAGSAFHYVAVLLFIVPPAA